MKLFEMKRIIGILLLLSTQVYALELEVTGESEPRIVHYGADYMQIANLACWRWEEVDGVRIPQPLTIVKYGAFENEVVKQINLPNRLPGFCRPKLSMIKIHIIANSISYTPYFHHKRNAPTTFKLYCKYSNYWGGCHTKVDASGNVSSSEIEADLSKSVKLEIIPI